MQSNPEILHEHKRVNVQDGKTEIVVPEQRVNGENIEEKFWLWFYFWLFIYRMLTFEIPNW